MTGWSRSSSSLLIECNCVTGTRTVISGSEFDGLKYGRKEHRFCTQVNRDLSKSLHTTVFLSSFFIEDRSYIT